MRSVKIESRKLLNILVENRAQHVKDYEEATVGYRQDAIAALEKALADAKAGNGEIQHYISVVKPASYKESYDTVIRMLELSSEPEVELTMDEFNKYVEDKWQWKQAFAETASFYNNKRG